MTFTYKVLRPTEFCGDIYGDYGYEINGEKSTNGYATRRGAESAMERKLTNLGFYD